MSPLDNDAKSVEDTKVSNSDSILDELNEVEDDKLPIVEDDEQEVEVKEKEDKEEEDKIEDTEEKEEYQEDELDLINPVKRKEILKVYPDIFKKFPYIERAIYREQEYSKIIPTVAEAKEIKAKADSLDGFEQSLISGNVNEVLRAVKDNDENAFKKIVDNYLFDLGKVEPRAVHHIIANVHSVTIQKMVQEARRSGNDALESAATILNQFVFGNSEPRTPQRLSNPNDDATDPAKEQLEKDRTEFENTRLNEHVNSLVSKSDNKIQSLIDINIDPKNSMNDYVKKYASREVSEKLESLMASDKHYQGLKDRLWKSAIQSNYSKESLDRIYSAHISKAKTLLPQVIKQARNEALKSMGKRVRDDEGEKGPISRGRPTTTTNSSKSKTVPTGMSNRDFIMSD